MDKKKLSVNVDYASPLQRNVSELMGFEHFIALGFLQNEIL